MKSFNKKESKFSLRKLSVGLASVTIAVIFLGTATVFADDNGVSEPSTTEVAVNNDKAPMSSAAKTISESFEEDVTVINENLIDGRTATDIVSEEITNAIAQPVVDEEVANVGDVISVETSASDPVITESEEGSTTTATSEATAQIVTTTKADSSEPVGVQEQSTVSYETSGEYETKSATITEKERVEKATTVEVIKVDNSTTTTTQGNNADIVFIIDTSGSMYDDIEGVKNNVTNFVSGLNQESITTRLGLIGYGTDFTTTSFNGSYFTTDTAEFITALEQLDYEGASEDPRSPLNFIASDYDWSTNTGSKRFAVVFTDEDIDIWDSDEVVAQGIAEAVANLKKANIATSFVYDTNDSEAVNEFTPFVDGTGGFAVDINQDYAEIMSNQLGKWVITNVNSDVRYYKVIKDDYRIFVEVVATEKPVETVKPAAAPVKATPKANVVKPTSTATAKKVVSKDELPKTGEKNSTAAVAGLGILITLLGTVGIKSRRKED